MIVVADTTPLNYLIQMQVISILGDLYEWVYLPGAVVTELRQPGAPQEVQRWAADLPAWIIVSETKKTVEADLLELDLGEQEAIVLVDQLGAKLLLVDDLMARIAAARRGIEIIGTLGILRDAANAGIVSFEEKASELLQLGFRATPDVLAQARAGLT